MYENDNELFLAQGRTDPAFNEDYIDRERKIIKMPRDYLFTPVKENYFKKHNLQVQFIGNATFLVNLMQNDVPPSLSITVPFRFYFFSTELVTLSLFCEANYNLFAKRISLEKYNNLNIVGAGGGAGISLSSFRQVRFNLVLGGGYAISYFLSDQYVGTVQFSGDPYVHPLFEFAYDVTEQISVSVVFSYLWVMYTGENIHSIQTGLGFGYRL
jgi:hypothetical protein